MMTKVRKPIAVLIAAIMILLLLPVSPALLPQAQASANVTVTSFDFSSSPPTSGRGTVSNVTANGFTFSANLGVNDAYTDEFGMMQVTPDTTYALHVDINDPTDTEIIVFYMENNSGDHWTNHIKAMDSTWNSGDLVFTVPQGIHYVRFRVDVNTMGNTRTFSNFRLTKFPSPHNMFPDISSWNLTGSGRLTQNKKVAEGFQCTAPYTDSYTGDTPLVAVAPGGHYWLTCDIDNPNDTELIAFFHRTSTSGWYSLTSTSNNKSLYIEVPSDVNYLTFRVDVNTQGNTRTFYNFRLYDDYWRYINLDNDFSLLQWQYEKGLNPGNVCEIRYRDPNYFTTYATGNDSYTDYSQAVPVSPNTTYTVACDNNGGSDTEMVVFYYRSDGSSCDPWVGGAYGSSLTFTAPSDCAYIRIRVDRNTAGNTTTFSNFRMYRADDYICCEPNYYLSYRSAWSSLPSPTRPGYSFGGWYTERGGNGYLITTVNPTSPYISLYAKWTKLNYTATLDADGGSVSPTSIGYAIDSTATLPTPSKEGYDFLGWKPTADSGNWSASQTYAAGTSLNGKYGDVTLKAQWQIKSYGVTFSADGTGYTNTTPASTVTHGGSVSFTVTLSEGYTNSGNPSVTATNGSVSSSKEGNTITYTVSNITSATAITVGAATLNTYTVKFVNSLTGEQIGSDQTVA
ncbi:MAG: InlB B-repeat-containing protein, partial [Clostridia bacterium]|nr:InlB B-repeat-containing protein [Clostridia bacterium]